jgi:succinate-semialdehyde dehydrogenase / glutarate-semialdehyde dehydrogenase
VPFTTVDPSTGRVLREYEAHGGAEVERRLALAADAFVAQRRSTFAERGARMRRLGELLQAEARALGRLMTREMGKPLAQAVMEAEKCAWVCRHYAEHAAAQLADEPADVGEGRALVRFQPLGAVLAIMPWNFPFWQVFRFAAPALMAGNVALLKHAPSVPGCALAIEDLFHRAGFGEGVFQTLLVEVDAVPDIIVDRRVHAATVTGSVAAGRAVAALAGRAIKTSVLELGGSDPFIIMPSADLDAALDTAVRARIQNNGQSCIAAKRFLVHASLYDDFLEHFTARMQTLVVGDPMDPATDLGPLAMERLRDNLHRQVRETVDAGGSLVTGGAPVDRPGWFYAPTVMTDVPPDSPAYREELFGPVAAVFPVADVADAIRLANDTTFGLGAAAWTNDDGERDRFIDELEAGAVVINGMVSSDPRLPFGGIKQSGYGRELGVFGIREFVNVKAVRF